MSEPISKPIAPNIGAHDLGSTQAINLGIANTQ